MSNMISWEQYRIATCKVHGSHSCWRPDPNRKQIRCLLCYKVRQQNVEKTPDEVLRNKLSQLKYRAKQENFICEINYETYLNLLSKQNQKCALSGLPFEPYGLFAPSVDRKDSTLGYTLENSQIVCWIVNKMKVELPEDLFLVMCLQIAKQTEKLHLLLND